MGLFDRLLETKKADTMTKAQKNRQKHAIWDYYKKNNTSSSKLNKTIKNSKKKK